jgi:hypothetical protein
MQRAKKKEQQKVVIRVYMCVFMYESGKGGEGGGGSFEKKEHKKRKPRKQKEDDHTCTWERLKSVENPDS